MASCDVVVWSQGPVAARPACFSVSMERLVFMAIVLMGLIERAPSAAAIHFTAVGWNIYLANEEGHKVGNPLPFNHAFNQAAGSILNVWVEPKPGAAALPAPAPAPAPAAVPAPAVPAPAPALSPSARSDIGSLKSAHSDAIEHSAGWSLLQAVHSAFPLAKVDIFEPLLLRRGKSSRPRINRIFRAGVPVSVGFANAQAAFSAVVATGRSLPSSARNPIDFTGDYSKTTFEIVEIDCLVKIPALPNSIWTRDPSSSSELVHIRAAGHEALPDRQLEAAPARAAGLPLEAAAARAAELPLPGADDERLSTTSALHYPPGASHYIIGEAYGPLNLDSAGASKPIQKLLQLERILCFILEKEGKSVADICSCVLGVVLIGPAMDNPACAAVFAALSHYQTSLQRLWALSEAGRLFAIRLQPLVTQLHHGLQRVEAATRAEAAATRAEVAATAAATRAELAELTAMVRSLAPLAAAGGAAGGGGSHRGGGRGGHRGGGGRGHRGGRGRGGGL